MSRKDDRPAVGEHVFRARDVRIHNAVQAEMLAEVYDSLDGWIEEDALTVTCIWEAPTLSTPAPEERYA
ncbi:hypothetical protein [Streptomyces sp. NBC_01727]|uniref:hypothetical protein n=1 Tax=Streptomyces sp. NBC_01727 TaxID=2975924 RepID=UPI002E1221CF|nr:hypothetical protein OIE76_41870 [Streptomyces sp. NBC_01727]